ncbi:MAG TPA: T9SS type A sorting domain-containing protein [Saprospiraceae bacterium]|nr:T9SS type A sorting domain-containing protein [Saprospiraceae bacterium]
MVKDMVVLPDGSIVGASAIGREKVYTNNVNADLYLYPSIFKMNPDQTLAWETPIGNGHWSVSHEMIRIVPASDGGGYVGTSSVYVVGTDVSPFKSVSLIAKVAENGDSLWTRYLYFWSDSLGDSYYHKIEDLAAAPGGEGYWLCGQTERQVSGEPLQQGWLLHTDRYGCLSPGCQLVGTGESSLEDKISLYPNPASEYLVVHHAGHSFSKGRFSIINLRGQVLRDWAAPMDDLSTVFDVGGFPAGAYVLQYREQDEVRLSKQFLVMTSR